MLIIIKYGSLVILSLNYYQQHIYHLISVHVGSLSKLYTIFVNGRLAILKNLGCLQLKTELNGEKGCVKISRYVQFSGHILI